MKTWFVSNTPRLINTMQRCVFRMSPGAHWTKEGKILLSNLFFSWNSEKACAFSIDIAQGILNGIARTFRKERDEEKHGALRHTVCEKHTACEDTRYVNAHASHVKTHACGTSSCHHLRGHKFPVPTVTSSRALKAFLPRSIILWNDLPPDIQALRTVASFKAALKKHLKL